MTTKQVVSIAIVGAGPAGLTLARLLLVSPLLSTTTNIKLNITIFEKDKDRRDRFDQGGCLDLHNDTGLAALKAANLWDAFQKIARYEGEELVIADKNATEIIHMTQDSKAKAYARPEIDRKQLQEMLLESVIALGGEDIIQWNNSLRSIDTSTNLLHFSDDSTFGPFNLVVGCDGAWSRVRQVLSSTLPTYSGICGWEHYLDNPTTAYPKISDEVGRGSFFAMSDGRTVMAQRQGSDDIKVTTYFLQKEPFPRDYLSRDFTSDQAAIKADILPRYQDWSEDLRSWVSTARTVRPWNLYELPVGFTFEHKKGYTIISDAAHLMTPFAGEGVNAGMRDALEISSAIVSALSGPSSSQASLLSNLDQSISAFETQMFARNKLVQQKTMRNKSNMFSSSPSAPVNFVVAAMDEFPKMCGYDPAEVLWVRIAFAPIKTWSWCYFEGVRRWGSWGKGKGKIIRRRKSGEGEKKE